MKVERELHIAENYCIGLNYISNIPITDLQQSVLPSLILYAGKLGSKYSKPRKTNPEKFSVSLSNVQKDILIGTLLGDACIERSKPNHNSRLRFDQTFPNHAFYLTSLYTHFKDLTSKCPSVTIRQPDKRTGKVYSTISFKTLSFPCLNTFQELFYKDNKKIIPNNIGELLTARALAYWIMDDGGKGSNGVMVLHTRSYTLTEVKLLQQVLLNNFNLTSRLSEKTPGQWVIILPVKQLTPLKDIVAPYMNVSMLYKL